MKIVCLGWGSLIWDPRDLKIKKGGWKEDGPRLPIELNRISTDKRITLVIDKDTGTEVNVLWTLMSVDDLPDAKESLRIREGTTLKNIHSVSKLQSSKSLTDIQLIVFEWLKSTDYDCAIWTGLSYKNNEGEEKSMTYEYIKNHLSSLTCIEAKLAERYIRKTAKQIRTKYRDRLEAELGWTPIEQ